MKGFLYLAALMIGSMPLGAFAQSDVYYIPSKKVKTITTTESSTRREAPSRYSAMASANDTYSAPYYEDTRDVDDYNRRGRNSSVSSVVDDSIAAVDDADANEKYSCTKHIIRFHSPRRGVIISSPYYWDICYDDPWDVYYDSWAYGLPSYAYWSYAYDPWYYNHWWYHSCWDFTWGWYDPWYGSYYWGWHHPLYWGWNRPYYGGWACHTHYWGHHHYNAGWDVPHTWGGGRVMANNHGFQVGGGRLGHHGIAQGGYNSRSNNQIHSTSVGGSRSTNHNNGLAKTFRSGSFAGNAQTSTSRSSRSVANVSQGAGYSRVTTPGGGGFTRGGSRSVSTESSRNYTTNSNGNRVYNAQPSTQYNSRSSQTSRSNNYDSRNYNSTNSRSYTPPTTSSSSRGTSSFGGSSSSRGSFGGGNIGGGGFNRGGGGGFSGGSRGGGRR